MAIVADTVQSTGRSSAAFFFVEAADGKDLSGNALDATGRASRGRGASMLIAPFERRLAAGQVSLRLRLRTYHVMPIASLFGSGNNESFGGAVQADLQADMRYRVNGVLDAFRRELWLEEEASGRLVGEKLVFRPELEDNPKLMDGAQHTCCNLHYDGDWISDANWSTAPMIPAGARIKVVEFKSDRANVLIEGRKFRVGQEYGMALEKVQALLGRLLVQDDPQARLAAYPGPVQAAVRAGKLRLGMNREQVMMAMGPPRIDKTRSLEQLEWIYFTFEEEPLKLAFDGDGGIKAFEATDKVKALLVLAD